MKQERRYQPLWFKNSECFVLSQLLKIYQTRSSSKKRKGSHPGYPPRVGVVTVKLELQKQTCLS